MKKALFFSLMILAVGFISKFHHNEDYDDIDIKFSKDDLKQDFRDFYGISWRGKPHDNLKYAKQMGYGYVFYQPGMEQDPLAKDLKFYMETPEYSVYPVPRNININKTYSDNDRKLYEKYFARKNGKSFPHNMATGWFSTPTIFSVIPDFQQKVAIDTFVNRIIRHAKSLERKENNFLFGGFAWDVPQLTGDFWDAMEGQLGHQMGLETRGRQITLAHWTGGDFAYQPAGVIFDFKSYSDGHAAFYKQLFNQTRQTFPNAKFMIEPWTLWGEWFSLIKDRPDAKEITPDMVNQEKDGTEFVDDSRVFSTGLITKEFVGLTSPNQFGEKENREYAAAAAINGSWFNWFGRFGGTGDMPNFKNVYELPSRLLLVRRVPNWDNLNSVPLWTRSWDGEVYKSPLSYMSGDIIWSTQPNTEKIFAVWLSQDGLLQLPDKSKLKSVFRTDSLYLETSNGRADIQVTDKGLKLINHLGIAKGYIITLEK